jgi:hypothetical protein
VGGWGRLGLFHSALLFVPRHDPVAHLDDY